MDIVWKTRIHTNISIDPPAYIPNLCQVDNDADGPPEEPSMRADMGVAALVLRVALSSTVLQHWDRVLWVHISPHTTLAQALYHVGALGKIH